MALCSPKSQPSPKALAPDSEKYSTTADGACDTKTTPTATLLQGLYSTTRRLVNIRPSTLHLFTCFRPSKLQRLLCSKLRQQKSHTSNYAFIFKRQPGPWPQLLPRGKIRENRLHSKKPCQVRRMLSTHYKTPRPHNGILTLEPYPYCDTQPRIPGTWSL